MINKIPEGDDYDISAMQNYILEIAKRERAVTNQIRLNNLKPIILWLGFILIALSLLFVVISYGVRLQKYPPIEKKVIPPPIPKELKLNMDNLKIKIDDSISANIKLDSTDLNNKIESYEYRLADIEKTNKKISEDINELNSGIKVVSDLINSRTFKDFLENNDNSQSLKDDENDKNFLGEGNE
jgi:hypothetical protein